MTSVSADLRCLAAWTEDASLWLEESARGPNDDADPMVRTVAFDAASLDDLITALRGVPGILEALANQVQERPALSVIQGGRR